MINPPLFHLQLGQVKEDAAKSLVPYTLRCSYGSKAHGIFINHPGTEPAYPILFIQDQQDAVLGPVMLHGQQAVALPSPAELITGKIQQIQQMFDVPQILTNGKGDPMRSSMTLIMYLNNHLYSKNYGMSGALSVMLFIITGILSLIVFKFSNNKQDK